MEHIPRFTANTLRRAPKERSRTNYRSLWSRISLKAYPVRPPKTENSLTALGDTIRPVMAAMVEAGLEHRSAIAIAIAIANP
jgi:hypothetical protein